MVTGSWNVVRENTKNMPFSSQNVEHFLLTVSKLQPSEKSSLSEPSLKVWIIFIKPNFASRWAVLAEGQNMKREKKSRKKQTFFTEIFGISRRWSQTFLPSKESLSTVLSPHQWFPIVTNLFLTENEENSCSRVIPISTYRRMTYYV